MKFKRREFLKTSLAVSATAALAGRVQAAPAGSSVAGREYYDLRAYRMKPGAPRGALDSYFEKALLPALDKRGVKNVGVFTELEVNKNAGTSSPKADSPVWVLIPYTTLDSFVGVSSGINSDPGVQKAGAEYLEAKKAYPLYKESSCRTFSGGAPGGRRTPIQ
jgi:hypothetical protein